MESLCPVQVCSIYFARKEPKRSDLIVLSTKGADKAKFHVKEYQDVAKCISKDFFSGSKQMNIKESPSKVNKTVKAI